MKISKENKENDSIASETGVTPSRRKGGAFTAK